VPRSALFPLDQAFTSHIEIKKVRKVTCTVVEEDARRDCGIMCCETLRSLVDVELRRNKFYIFKF